MAEAYCAGVGAVVQLISFRAKIDPETAGVDAYCMGIPRTRCPYEPETESYRAWLRGWDEAAQIDREDQSNEA